LPFAGTTADRADPPGRVLPRPGRSFGVLLLALLLVAPTARAHRGHAFGNPFHDSTLAEACQLARDEHKLVFVYVTDKTGRPPPYLQMPNWNDWRAIDLLIRETVAVQLDGRRDGKALAPYDVTPPQMLLLDAVGSLRARWPGDWDAEQLSAGLRAELAEPDTLDRLRAAVAAAEPDDGIPRERLADLLTTHGRYDEALATYRWCVEKGLRRNIPYAAARRRLVFKGFARLAEQHPPAAEALQQIRAEMVRTLTAERDDANLARDLAALDFVLGQRADTLAVFDRLPERSRARYVLFDRVLPELVEAGRYDEVLAMVRPQQAFQQEVRLARQQAILWVDTPAAAEMRGQRNFAVQRGALLVEALAGAGRTAEARRLVDAILRFDDRPRARQAIAARLARVEAPELAEYLAASAEPETP
jgi:tetratricopeptide (TPR) repeat protein